MKRTGANWGWIGAVIALFLSGLGSYASLTSCHKTIATIWHVVIFPVTEAWKAIGLAFDVDYSSVLTLPMLISQMLFSMAIGYWLGIYFGRFLTLRCAEQNNSTKRCESERGEREPMALSNKSEGRCSFRSIDMQKVGKLAQMAAIMMCAVCMNVSVLFAIFKHKPMGLYGSYNMIPHSTGDVLRFTNGIVSWESCCGQEFLGSYEQLPDRTWIWHYENGKTNKFKPDFILRPGLFSLICSEADHPTNVCTLPRMLFPPKEL